MEGLEQVLNRLFEDGADAYHRYGGLGQYTEFDDKKKKDVEYAIKEIEKLQNS